MKSGYSKSLWVTCLASLFCTVALAQDPLKVEPAHYKLAFENEYVQVVNVHYGPHEKSGLHSHMGGVVVVLTAGHLRFTDENGKTQEIPAGFRPSSIKWRTSETRPTTLSISASRTSGSTTRPG
jgi:hypothetical protein